MLKPPNAAQNNHSRASWLETKNIEYPSPSRLCSILFPEVRTAGEGMAARVDAPCSSKTEIP